MKVNLWYYYFWREYVQRWIPNAVWRLSFFLFLLSLLAGEKHFILPQKCMLPNILLQTHVYLPKRLYCLFKWLKSMFWLLAWHKLWKFRSSLSGDSFLSCVKLQHRNQKSISDFIAEGAACWRSAGKRHYWCPCAWEGRRDSRHDPGVLTLLPGSPAILDWQKVAGSLHLFCW